MYLEALSISLLCGLSLVNGFFHFRRKDFLFRHEQSFNKSILRSDPTHWIEQLVNHFNDPDHRTWRQKYYEVMDSWKPEGPILLVLGGEAGITRDMVEMLYSGSYGDESTSLIRQIAVETSAALFILEHRYYGASQPFHERTIENMAFLHSRQALADAAHLLKTIKKSRIFRKSKVIVVGCSYAGNLAAWMKLMYPELVDAALASSAPVLAKKDFYEYLEAVTDTFRTYGSQECVDKITERFNTFRELFRSPERITEVKGKTYTCENLTMIQTYWAAAQNGIPTDISSICHVVKNCSQYHFYTSLEPDALSDRSSDEQSWTYQSCTEFRYYVYTSRSTSKQMFGKFGPEYSANKICRDSFGEEFDEERIDQGVINTNRMYGGLTPNVTNVVFVNGDMDPWHKLSIVKDLSADAPAIFIKGSSHCHDLNPHPSDTDNIKEARKQIKTLLKKWIGQKY